MMGDIEEAISCYDKALEIDPNSSSILYNKRFALYSIKKVDAAAVCKAKLDEIDPGFEDALQKRGTRFFLPETYDSTLNYSLPSRWYEGGESVSINVSTNKTEVTFSGVFQKLDNNTENNSINYTLQPNKDQGNQDPDYWSVFEPGEE
jgi:tetratricopeptide (TPR) repeat protein